MGRKTILMIYSCWCHAGLGIFQKLVIYWEFPTQTSVEFTENEEEN